MKIAYKIIIAVVALLASACSNDFLDRPPIDQVVADNFYNNAAELRMATGPLYNHTWFDYNDKCNFAIGDGAGGNFVTNDGAYLSFTIFATTSTSVRLNEAWRSLYVTIAQANSVIRNINLRASNLISESDKNVALAEARFIRGYAYSYLALLWGHVPIIEDNVEQLLNPILPRNKVEDVFDFAIRDLEFAAQNLLKSDLPGRVTQWSAKGVLARLYLYRSGLGKNIGSRDQNDLNKAKEYAADVIKNSGLELMKEYEDLFKLANNNNPESLFALQWVDNQTNWGAQNSHQAYLAAEGKLTGVGDGWGGANGGTPSILGMYGPNDARRKATFMLKGDLYPELLKAEGGYNYNLESSAGSAVKKYVIGTPQDNGGRVAFMSTSINTYMLRLAEVYLIYAEAILGNNTSTTDDEALKYYNMVRNRSKLPNDENGSLTFLEIFNETRLELVMEGHLWFNLVRWHYFDKAGAINYIANQDRGNWSWSNGEKSPNSLFVTPKDADFKLVYPEVDVINNPLLKEPPVGYVFK
jgi:starch-binding outer membrane protein, SusD/RagB family